MKVSNVQIEARRAFAHEFCIEIYQRGVNVGKNWAAEVCDKRAEIRASKAETTDDQDDSTELKANAWQFSVLAAEIRKPGHA